MGKVFLVGAGPGDPDLLTVKALRILERAEVDFVERVGIERVRRETVYAARAVQEASLARLAKSKELTPDAWLERSEPRNPTQFVQIQPIKAVHV